MHHSQINILHHNQLLISNLWDSHAILIWHKVDLFAQLLDQLLSLHSSLLLSLLQILIQNYPQSRYKESHAIMIWQRTVSFVILNKLLSPPQNQHPNQPILKQLQTTTKTATSTSPPKEWSAPHQLPNLPKLPNLTARLAISTWLQAELCAMEACHHSYCWFESFLINFHILVSSNFN